MLSRANIPLTATTTVMAVFLILSLSTVALAESNDGVSFRQKKIPQDEVEFRHAHHQIRDSDGRVSVGLHDNAWWFMDEAGDPFLSLGVNHVSWEGEYCPFERESPYHVNVKEEFHQEEAWAYHTSLRLAQWDVNTLGRGSDPNGRNFREMYHVDATQYSELSKDWFDPAFEVHVDEATLAATQRMKGREKILGYFIGHNIDWGYSKNVWPVWKTEERSILIQYLTYGTRWPGYNRAIEFLQDRYESISNLNAAWYIKAQSFETIAREYPFRWPSQDRRDAELDFLLEAADRFYSVVTRAIRKYDPLAVILGSQQDLESVSPSIIELEGEYVDVVSFSGIFTEPFVDISEKVTMVADLAKKPVLVSDVTFRAYDAPGVPNVFGPGIPVLSQRERSEKLVDFVEKLAKNPMCVGYHWFQYMDQPSKGNLVGEDSNVGLVNSQDEPYTELVETFASLNSRVKDLHQ